MGFAEEFFTELDTFKILNFLDQFSETLPYSIQGSWFWIE